MKDRIARLLLAYLTRLGFVLWATDPSAAAAPASDPSGQLPQGEAGASDSEGTDGEHGDEGNTEGDAGRDPRDKQIRKLERRIGNRTKALGQQAERIAQLQAENERLRNARTTSDPDDPDDETDDPPSGKRPGAVDVDALATERAVELRRREKIAERTAAMLDAGAKLEPKFRDLVLDLADDLPFVDAKGRATEFIEEVLDTDAPAALLLHLAQHPEAVESLQGLTGAKLGRRIERLVIEAKKAPAPSRVPAPLTPVTGRGNTAKAETAMSDAEWLSQRRKAA